MSESESENNSDSNDAESSENEEAADVVETLNPEKSEEEIVSWKDLVSQSLYHCSTHKCLINLIVTIFACRD